MSKNISLFSGYEQKENRTTNYCLLVLKMLYEENPKYLSEVLSTLVGAELGDHVGVQFNQKQKPKTDKATNGASIPKSVPDALIMQQSFAVYIETKNFDWFHDSQLEEHLRSLNNETAGLKILIALSNFESSELN
ncbi:MAG: hypothetical protein WCO51_09870, partial [bacterium]